ARAGGPRPGPDRLPHGGASAAARHGSRVRDLRRPVHNRYPSPHQLGHAAAARPRVHSRRAHRTRADLRSRPRPGRRRLRTSGARPRPAKGRSVKVALFGHGTMGRVLEESARAAGLEIGVIITSANVGDAARLLPGHSVAVDFSAPAAVPAHVEAAAAAGVPLVEGTTGWQREEATRVPIASTRAGHMAGTHRVGFDSVADQILLVHTARSRAGFAVGALLAARWIVGRRGMYAFTDVLDDILRKA